MQPMLLLWLEKYEITFEKLKERYEITFEKKPT
jgi:hypothetical protein